jgi:acyl-CoA thioester hydrolase
MDAVYRFEIKVPNEVVDGNGHVNNVAYVQWMQDAAIRHSDAAGCTAGTLALGATWVARTHHVEYLRPCFAGETVLVLTWVSNFRKVRTLRKYKFVRPGDHTVLVQAETDWVLVDAKTGRARAIPEVITEAFQIVAPDQEP